MGTAILSCDRAGVVDQYQRGRRARAEESGSALFLFPIYFPPEPSVFVRHVHPQKAPCTLNEHRIELQRVRVFWMIPAIGWLHIAHQLLPPSRPLPCYTLPPATNSHEHVICTLLHLISHDLTGLPERGDVCSRGAEADEYLPPPLPTLNVP